MTSPADILPPHSRIRTSEEVALQALRATRAWLPSRNLDDPSDVIAFRSRVIDILAYARIDRLSTAVTLDLQEAARRCERWIAASIRRAQQQRRVRGPGTRDLSLMSSEEFAEVRQASTLSPYYTWYGLSDQAFEELLAQGRANGTLAQMPLMAIVRERNGGASAATVRHRQRIIELADQQMTSRQIAHAIGMRVDIVKRIAASAGIEILADQVAGKKSRHIDPERIVRETVAALEGMAIGLRMLDRVDFEVLDTNEVEQWLQSLDKSLPTIASLKKELRRAKRN